jgi:hypothetical protein
MVEEGLQICETGRRWTPWGIMGLLRLWRKLLLRSAGWLTNGAESKQAALLMIKMKCTYIHTYTTICRPSKFICRRLGMKVYIYFYRQWLSVRNPFVFPQPLNITIYTPDIGMYEHRVLQRYTTAAGCGFDRDARVQDTYMGLKRCHSLPPTSADYQRHTCTSWQMDKYIGS